MNKKITLLRLSQLFITITCFASTAQAQISEVGVRVNLLSWATLSPGLGAEVMWNQRYLAAIDGSYGDFCLTSHRRELRMSSVGAEVRRYLDNDTSFQGLYFGAGTRWLKFNRQQKSHGKEGELWMAGLNAGYTLRICGSWSADATIGAGYVHRNYDRYEWYSPVGMYRKTGSKSSGTFGITAAAINIIYRFNANSFKK